MSGESTASASDYVLSLALPETGPALETRRPPLQFSDRREAVTVGAALAEFTDAVPAGARAAIADGILLAQLAANKAAIDADDVFGWYDKYLEVLQNIGWHARDIDFRTQTVNDRASRMHTAILPVITAMLGPQAAAASIILAVLNGLEQMDTTTSWMTLFNRASQHSHGAKFQVSYIDADRLGDPEVSLLALGIRANSRITQVLFFKLSTQDVELKKAEARMAINMQRLESAKDAIASRVTPFVNDYIAALEI